MSRAVVDAIDERVDAVFGRWRGRPVADGLAYGASALGDHGLVWFLIGLARGRRPGRRFGAAWAVIFSGIVTPVVNAAVKSAVGRGRPDPRHDDPPPVRVPTSTSFPSGHALAAWCAATLLAEDDPLGPAYYLVAAAVSVSRVHLRQHHASDVAAGAVLGITLGHAGRRMARPWRWRSTPRGMRSAGKALEVP
ncbi:MAG TPA: phosphatase PAP2 family protein [Acidimicrobiales bacterium]|nr:phosphatase PAP2 family protein [Acidimicrobiales bacterium]